MPQELNMRKIKKILKQINWVMILIIFLACWFRFMSAFESPLEAIEKEEFIPFASSISWSHLPIREYQHAALPGYLIKVSSVLFGSSLFGYRIFNVLAGIGTILLLYMIGRRWWGPSVGNWAAFLLAVDRYHINISARAIDLSFDLFFIALAMWAFSRFLHSVRITREQDLTPQPKWLYVAAIASGLGFLCKEITALILPVFFLTFLFSKERYWLKRKDPWIAVLLFFIVISPDILWNLITSVQSQKAGYYMNYKDHLSRISSLGWNDQPWLFYFGDVFDWLDIPYRNEFSEFHFINPLLGIILWAGVIYCVLCKNKDSLTVFLLVMFIVIFVFFASINLKTPTRSGLRTDAVGAWYWVDRTMLAATLLSGRLLALVTTRMLYWLKLGKSKPNVLNIVG